MTLQKWCIVQQKTESLEFVKRVWYIPITRAIVQEGERCGGTTFPDDRRTSGATPGDSSITEIQ